MKSFTASLVYDRQIEGFNARYYITSKTYKGCTVTDAYTETERRMIYGVMLEKVNGGITAETAEAPLSWSAEAVLRVLKVLYDMEVTPVSFYEVIDEIIEKEALYA